MNAKTLLLVAALLVTTAATAAAQENDGRKISVPNQCQKETSEVDTQKCLERVYNQVNSALNQTYKALRAKLSPKEKARLTSAQREWIRQRDKKCQAAHDLIGGTGGGAAYQSCMIEETEAKRDQLKARLK